MNNSKITMAGMAKDLGVSRTTLSVCLTGDPKKYRIKEETVNRIRDHADKLGFVPNASARSLVMQENATKKIGLLVLQEYSEGKNYRALHLATKILNNNGYEYLYLNGEVSQLASLVTYLKSAGISEIVLFGSFPESILHKELFINDKNELRPLFKNMNLYILDYYFSSEKSIFNSNNIYSLGINRKEMYFNLFDIASKKYDGLIACDNNCLPFKDCVKFFNSINTSFKKAQYFTLNYTIVDPFDRGKDLAKRFLTQRKDIPIKVIFIHDDKIAAGFIYYLIKKGLKIPDDVAVAGFDNIDSSGYYQVPLTTVELPFEKHVEICMSKIVNGKKISNNIISEPTIIWRESFGNQISYQLNGESI